MLTTRQRVEAAILRIPDFCTYDDNGQPWFDAVVTVVRDGRKAEAHEALRPLVNCGDTDSLRSLRQSVQCRPARVQLVSEAIDFTVIQNNKALWQALEVDETLTSAAEQNIDGLRRAVDASDLGVEAADLGPGLEITPNAESRFAFDVLWLASIFRLGVRESGVALIDKLDKLALDLDSTRDMPDEATTTYECDSESPA